MPVHVNKMTISENKVYGIVDINNCFVSCERVFNPRLINKACIVLSNNDGCVVARSQEAKALGIKMGVPVFKIKDLILKNDVQVLSSNYELYGEMSRRFHKLLEGFVDPLSKEIYSIDEAFLDLTDYQSLYDPYQYSQLIKKRINDWLNLPVCIGLGRSKTEAKLANYIAKNNPHFNGVCDLILMDLCSKEQLYNEIDVTEVWGVGHQISKKLKSLNINTVFDLACADEFFIKRQFSIVLQRTVLELRGISCLNIEHTPPPKKQIVSSRTFGNAVTTIDELKRAVVFYLQDAFKRLRSDLLLCGHLTVFANSSPFDTNTAYYSKSQAYTFPTPTDNLLEMSKAAAKLIEEIYAPDVKFKKCGVMLSFLEPKATFNYDLLTDPVALKRNENLMASIEDIHKKFGKNQLALGASQLNTGNWQMSRSNLSINPFSIKSLLRVN